MVLDYHGHWHSLDSTPQSAVQWNMALLDIYRSVWAQCLSLREFHFGIDFEICTLSRDLGSDDSTSYAIPVSWHFSNGSSHYRQHGGLRMRAGMGSLDNHLRLGIVVDRCGHCSGNLLLFTFRSVSFPNEPNAEASRYDLTAK